MTNRPEITIQHQTAFTADGDLEPTEESVATSLEDFGADVSHREVETRLDRPVASEFGVDDRIEVRHSEVDDTDQASLFADTADDQQTLTGEDASAQFLFDSSGENSD
ncbi:hypothetical protein [Natrialba sp. INN-245]|uniref:hypothetical protein n=1 Tax=Natrialba sp. INN-245 TaxID=2690967 RepID=UPI0013119FC9|nr:hypothetical protein [Natrialba sp. INN-245]MWV39618.1 hypothetical protein [Natrialba sp. INN-245]